MTTLEQLELLSRLGFNRVSLGVQDFTEKVQKAIGRDQTYEQTEVVFNKCRELGFDGINIDLIYGLPLQTIKEFSETIAQVVRLGADRVGGLQLRSPAAAQASSEKYRRENPAPMPG